MSDYNSSNPYKKRAYEGASSLGDVTSGYEVGFQSVKVSVDFPGIQSALQQPGSVLPLITQAARTVPKGTGLFTLINTTNQSPLVSHVVNGLDSRFGRYYANDPEMMRLCMKAIMRPLGTAAEHIEETQDIKRPLVANKYMGIEVRFVNRAQAGRRMKWDIRRFYGTPGQNGVGANQTQVSEYNNAYGLEMVPSDEETIGTTFNKMASQLITNSSTWEAALQHYAGTAQPHSAAVHADLRHLQTALVLGIDLALRYGFLVVPDAAMHQYRARDKIYATNADANVRFPAELRVAGDTPAAASGALPSYEVAARIANLIGLTAPSNPVTGLLDADGVRNWAEYSHTLVEMLYYSADLNTGGSNPQSDGSLAGSINVAVEFGAEQNNGMATLNGRHMSTLSVKEDLIGSVVDAQINHTRRALAAYAHAVDQEYTWLAGTAYSNATNGQAKIFMHK